MKGKRIKKRARKEREGKGGKIRIDRKENRIEENGRIKKREQLRGHQRVRKEKREEGRRNKERKEEEGKLTRAKI